jgi:hypothetical protein
LAKVEASQLFGALVSSSRMNSAKRLPLDVEEK